MFFSKPQNLVGLCSLLLLASCGGGDVGKQEDIPPTAKAEIIGASQFTSGLVEVRSGTDVVLSGHASDGGDDPILHFIWTQEDSPGTHIPVTFYERASNSVAFSAPFLPVNEPEGVELRFKLTVLDADGATAEDFVSVLIKPTSDLNRYLQEPQVKQEFLLFVAAEAGSTLENEIPVELQMTPVVSWFDRDGQPRSMNLDTQNFSGTVAAGLVPASQDARNLFFRIQVPMLDTDDINVEFQGLSRPGRLEFENVAAASMQLDFNLRQTVAGNISMSLAREGETGIELIDTEGMSSDVNNLSLSEEWLRQQLVVESRRSSQNYYDCIDPSGEAATLSGWIEQAGFAQYPEEITHATYVNNFDLGFGRDMYFRQDENGNVYSYVVNYPNLENSLTGRNEFAVVVMEFSAAPTGNCGDGSFTEDVGGEKIVKFYAYVPDEVSGEYVRAGSMNFDGRGERFLPGVCIVCHFGETNVEQFNAADLNSIAADAADLDSSFMLFDMDSFLYTSEADESRIDPVYASEALFTEVTAQYSRENQEESFRALNQSVLHTFTYDPQNLKRFELPIKAVHGWYGNSATVENLDFGTSETPIEGEALDSLHANVSTLPDNNFNSEAYTPAGWLGQEDLYHNVFARNCRLCHLQIGKTAVDFDSYEEFITNERLVPYVFERGLMPLSRLTMDRFWVDYFAGDSSAELLRQHLNSDNIAGNDVASDARPGFPVAQILPGKNDTLATDLSMEFDDNIVFEASSSFFADSYEWSLDGEVVSYTDKFILSAGQPGEQNTVSLRVFDSVNNTVSREESRSVETRDNAPVVGDIPSAIVTEGQSVDIQIYSSLCDGLVDSRECRAIFGDILPGQTPSITIIGAAVNGTVDAVDNLNGVVSFTSTAPSASGDASFNFTLSDSFGESSTVENQLVRVNSIGGPQVGGPDVCTVEAISSLNENQFPQIFGNPPCADPTANDSAGPGLSLSLLRVDASASRDGTAVFIDGDGNINYRPGKFFSGTDSFSYTVVDNSLSANQSFGTVVVTVNPTQTFSDLSSAEGVFNRNSTESGCAECHDGDLAPDWRNLDSVRLIASNTEEAPYGTPEIELRQSTNTEDLLTSILFRMACNEPALNHEGENRLCLSDGAPSSVDDLNADGRAILTWIEEGMQDN